MKFLLMVIAMVFAPVLAMAQDAAAVVGNDQFLLDLLQSVGGIKGASTLAIVLMVTKLLLKFMNTPMGFDLMKKLDDDVKLLVVSFLTVVTGVVGLMMTGVSFWAALLHSTTLAAVSVFINQIYKKFIQKSKV